MARSSIARSCSVWRFSPVEWVCEGPIWEPRRLPMERSDMVTPQMFLDGFAYRHWQMSCTRQELKREQLVARTCFSVLSCSARERLSTFESRMYAWLKSLCTCDVRSGLPHCASKTPLHLWYLIPNFSVSILSLSIRTSDNMLYETGEGIADWIRTHLGATSLEGQSGYLADPILLTLHRGEAKCFGPNVKEADLWVNIWEDPFWRHYVWRKACQMHRTMKARATMTLVEQIVTQRNQSGDWLAKKGADLDGGVGPRWKAATVRQLCIYIKRKRYMPHCGMQQPFVARWKLGSNVSNSSRKQRTSGPLQTQ